MHIPKISSGWRPLFKPERFGTYVNDHSIIKNNDGWHLFGITSFEGEPAMERYFVYASAPSLDGAMEERCRVIDNGTRA